MAIFLGNPPERVMQHVPVDHVLFIGGFRIGENTQVFRQITRQMVFDKTEIDAIKRYCEKVFLLEEAGVTFLQLQRLRLPEGCTPSACDALLCPVDRGGYPSRLYFAEPVSSAFTRNWAQL